MTVTVLNKKDKAIDKEAHVVIQAMSVNNLYTGAIRASYAATTALVAAMTYLY